MLLLGLKENSHTPAHGGVQFSKFSLICPISPTKTQILVF